VAATKAKIHRLLKKARTQDDWMTRLEENTRDKKWQKESHTMEAR